MLPGCLHLICRGEYSAWPRVLATARRARVASRPPSSESERGAGGGPQRAGAQRLHPRGSPVGQARWRPWPGRELRSS